MKLHSFSNTEIARLLENMAIYYDMDEVAFKPRAYERAAAAVASLDEQVADVYTRDGRKGLQRIPGVGPGIAFHVESLLTTGTFGEYEKYRKRIPVALDELRSVEGLGPKTILLLWKKLKIKNLKELEAAARAGRLRSLPRLGEKAERRLLKGVEFQKQGTGRFSIGMVRPLVLRLEDRLRRLPGVVEVTTAGSYRRWQETVGDIDILATAKDPERVIASFAKFPEVMHVYGKGPTKINVRFRDGIDGDLRVLHPDEYGSALQYFTGDKIHNVAVRKIAIKRGLKLSEYGVFRGKRRVAGRTEEDVYRALGLDVMPPELRTASGEIEAARAGRLPTLIPFGSLKGDLQVQTDWTDGSASIEAMAKAARAAGLDYIAITDHTRTLAMTGGLDEKKLERQGREIDKLNVKLKPFRILKSAEVNILKDGRLDIADATLGTLDVVSAAVHTDLKLSERQQTERILRAMKHPRLHVLFHLTGRLIGKREPMQLDIMKILRAAKEYGVVMEANAQPARLDLRDAHIRDAVRLGVKLVVDSDAHGPNQFEFLEYGIAQVRRGWGTTRDVLNTLSVEKFLNALRLLKK